MTARTGTLVGCSCGPYGKNALKGAATVEVSTDQRIPYGTEDHRARLGAEGLDVQSSRSSAGRQEAGKRIR